MAGFVTIVELPSFARDVAGDLNEESLFALKSYLAEHPDAGVVIKNTGGLRKLRWAASGKGKRDGGRVIY